MFDTRVSDQVGPRIQPLAAGETFSQAVRGSNGNCVIPADASAVAMNVTIDNPTAAGFLTIWPSDAGRPLASSLNWAPDSLPTPNKVDTKLSADGRISLYNSAGTVDVLADVVGYYVDHQHDDRYYTKAELDSALGQLDASKADKPTGTTTLVLDSSQFKLATFDDDGFTHDFGGIVSGAVASQFCVSAPVVVPDAATITGFTAHTSDTSSVLGFKAFLFRDPIGFSNAEAMADASSSGLGAPGPVVVTAAAIANPVVDLSANSYWAAACSINNQVVLFDIVITYTNPA